MMTVHEVSRLTGVSIRTLQYYDRIGLLHPAEYTGAGYRLYDEAALETLQQILLFRELEFPLKEIRQIIRSPSFDRRKALDQQIQLLELKKEHLDSLIALARDIRTTGGKKKMDFSAFDTKKMDEYAARAKETWGGTPAYQEYEMEIKKQIRGRNRGPEPADGRSFRGIRRHPGRSSGIGRGTGPGQKTEGFYYGALLYLHRPDPGGTWPDVCRRRRNDGEH